MLKRNVNRGKNEIISCEIIPISRVFALFSSIFAFRLRAIILFSREMKTISHEMKTNLYQMKPISFEPKVISSISSCRLCRDWLRPAVFYLSLILAK
jgi:hypothetical protein